MRGVYQTQSQPPAVDLQELIDLFYDHDAPPASFHKIDRPETMPEPYNRLLNHHAHMTVTVEAFHGCPVDVQVIRTKSGETTGYGDVAPSRWYAREILLHRQTDRIPVQYGIVRLNVHFLAPEVWEEIRSEQIPLGRVLIKHGVLREVELCELWEVIPNRGLQLLLGMESDSPIFGRTARIFCDNLPAIELLEIVVV